MFQPVLMFDHELNITIFVFFIPTKKTIYWIINSRSRWINKIFIKAKSISCNKDLQLTVRILFSRRDISNIEM